jgi:hypothetical protein
MKNCSEQLTFDTEGRDASESWHPARQFKFNIWIPASAGMTAD